MTDPDAIETLLRAVLDELAALRADLRTRGQPAPLTPEDHAILRKLLPVIGGLYGSAEFYSAEICEHDAPALRLVAAGLTPRRLGRLLRRAADTPIGGYMVQRGPRRRAPLLWHVVEVAANTNLSVPHAASPPMRRWRREITDAC